MPGITASKRSFKMSMKTGSAAALVDLSPYFNDSSVTQSRNLPEDTTYDPTGSKGQVKTYAPTLQDGSFTVGGPWTDDLHFFLFRHFQEMLAETDTDQPHYEFGPFGRASGQPKSTGNGFINRADISIDATGIMMVSGEAQMSGAPTWSSF